MPEPAVGPSDGPHVQTETERKFALLPGAVVPDLSALAAVGEPHVDHLDATYFDSPTYDLVRSRAVLRRRSGGEDEAWHLKLPKDSGTPTGAGAGTPSRTEVHVPLGATPDPLLVPTELRALVTDRVGPVPLVPIARLETVRTVRVLSDPTSGSPLAELADDTVTATRAALPGIEGRTVTWRELEVELRDAGTADFLDAVTERLQWAGIVPAASPSKLAHALGDAPQEAAERTVSPDTALLQVVMTALGVHIGVLQSRQEDVRVDGPDAVHKTRVASRRLRSILRVFRSLFDTDSVGTMREELKWYAERLGHARDAEVQKQKLTAQLAALPAEAVVGPVGRRMEAELEATHQEALGRVRECLASDRYRDLMVALSRFLTDPPLAADAPRDGAAPDDEDDESVLEESTADLAPALVHRAIRRVRKAYARAEASEGQERLESLHEVRKKAKVVRYACEALVPAYGEPAADAARAWAAVTEVFGEMNDAVVARTRLAGIAEAAALDGEPTFTYGVLYGTQMGSLERDMPAARAALKRAIRRGPETWDTDDE